MSKQRGFWRERLRGAPALLDLPADYPRPPQQDFRGGRVEIAVSPALTKRVRELAKREGATLFMALMAAFKILLYRYSGQDDVVVGTPVAGRNRPELEPLIGCFLNMLAIRTRIDETQNFSTFLQAVKTAALTGFANEDVPLEKLLEDLAIERNLAYSPLYQTAFSFEENPLDQVRMRDLELTFEEVETGTAKVDLALELTVAGEGLSGWFEYRADLFAPWRMERLRDHFLTLLASIVKNPEAPVWSLNLLADGEREALIAQGQGERRDYPLDRAIHRLFEQQVDRTPGRITLTHRGETLSYSQLDERANRVAALLRDRGVIDNALVGIMVAPSFAMIAGIWGILKAGAGYVYFEKTLPDERVKFILDDAGITAILVDPDVKQRVAALGVAALDLEAESRAFPGTRRNVASGAPMSRAYAVFTSGSTGTPKGACVDHRGLVNHTCAFIESHDLDENDRVLQFASPSFDAAAATLFPPLLIGAALVIPDGDRADLAGEKLLRFCDEQRISVIHLPVSLWHEWVDDLRERALVVEAPIKVMLVGGDVPDLHRFETWRQLTAGPTTFLNAYGPTEAVITTTLFKTRCDKAVEPVQEITLGYPLPNKQIYLLDDHLQPVPLGVPGEICVAGVGLASGYLNRPDLTDQVFVPNPFATEADERMYRTGDLACYRPDGSLRFLGRRDHQVKLRGFRVELGEIEQVLRGHANVQDAVVVAREGADGLKRLAAYLIARDGQPTPDAELLARLKKSLPDYMVPASLQWLDRFPLTATGKLDRRALPVPEDKRRDTEGYVAPRTREEDAIAIIWAEALKCDQVGIRDNFFDLGGHSLLGARVIARVRERFGGDIPLRALFEHPTVEALAAWVSQGRSSDAGHAGVDELPRATPDPKNRYQPFPLNDVQQAYWIGRGDSLEMGNVSCHGFMEFDSANLDVPRLNRAWLRLVERHDMLRTVIDPDGMQRVLPEVPAYEFAVADLSALSDRGRENALTATRERMSHQVHDVERWPLFEIRVSRLDDHRVRLHVSIDLLIADARSFQILLIELCKLYQNPSLTLPPLTFGFRDYVLAEAAIKNIRPYREAENYWKKRLEILPPAPELPLAVAPKSIVKPVFTRRSGCLERPHWESLKARARRAGITPSAMTLGV
ncbi:MAG: amino acid adenylation domain-containing protein, partial [Candidatus Competibacteraceae bacterium]